MMEVLYARKISCGEVNQPVPGQLVGVELESRHSKCGMLYTKQPTLAPAPSL